MNEETIEKVVAEFVSSRNGKYRKVMPDETLVKLLTYLIFSPNWHRLPDMTDVSKIMNIVYNETIWLFESFFEKKMGIISNGHHAAQVLSGYFKKELQK